MSLNLGESTYFCPPSLPVCRSVGQNQSLAGTPVAIGTGRLCYLNIFFGRSNICLRRIGVKDGRRGRADSPGYSNSENGVNDDAWQANLPQGIR